MKITKVKREKSSTIVKKYLKSCMEITEQGPQMYSKMFAVLDPLKAKGSFFYLAR